MCVCVSSWYPEKPDSVKDLAWLEANNFLLLLFPPLGFVSSAHIHNHQSLCVSRFSVQHFLFLTASHSPPQHHFLLFFSLLLQVAQARLNKSGMRPLGRTQSAPLPLGHPLLQGVPPPPGVLAAAAAGTTPLTQQQFDMYMRERHYFDQQQQHNLMKQQLRQSVLTRAGSRSQVENVEEETEAAVAREMMSRHTDQRTAHNPEIIDLTEQRLEEEAAAAAAAVVAEARRRDGLPPLRVAGPRASIQSSAGKFPSFIFPWELI